MALQKRPASGVREALRPSLGVLDLTLIGVGASVGSGIFVIVGAAVQPTGPAVCISFAFAAVSSIFSALGYAELAARIPESGSVYLYAYVAFGEFVALLFGLNVMVDYHFGAALGVLSCGSYLRDTLLGYFGHDASVPDARILAVLLVALLTATLCVGVEEGMKKINGLLVSVKVTIVVIIIAAGLSRMHGDNLAPFAPFGMWPVLSTSTTCCFAYIGFGTVANAAEECVNPRRDLPIGIIVSLAICSALYIAFALVLCGIVPFRNIDPEAPVADAFGPKYANIPWVLQLVDWGAIIGLYTTLLSGLYSQARMYLAMSRDGLITRSLSIISPRFGTPLRSQVLCGLIAAVLAICFPVKNLVRFLNIGVLLSYTVVCAGVLVLRAEKPGSTAGCCTVLTVATVAAGALVEVVGRAPGGPVPQVLCAIFILVGLAACYPLCRQRYTVPETFACPLCPVLPVLGVAINGYLLAQCHWEAWARLAGTTVFIILIYVVRVLRAVRSGGNGAAPCDENDNLAADS